MMSIHVQLVEEMYEKYILNSESVDQIISYFINVLSIKEAVLLLNRMQYNGDLVTRMFTVGRKSACVTIRYKLKSILSLYIGLNIEKIAQINLN